MPKSVPKPVFSAEELERYKAVVGFIIDGNEEKKKRMDIDVRLAIATAKKQMPAADDEILVSFFSSVAFMAAHLANVKVKDIAEIIEQTFDLYSVATAHVMGAYDIEGDEVPVKPETAPGDGASRDPEREAELDALLSRQYL